MLEDIISLQVSWSDSYSDYLKSKVLSNDNKLISFSGATKKAINVDGYLFSNESGLEDILCVFKMKVDIESYSMEDTDNDLKNEGMLYQEIIKYFKFLIADGAAAVTIKSKTPRLKAGACKSSF